MVKIGKFFKKGGGDGSLDGSAEHSHISTKMGKFRIRGFSPANAPAAPAAAMSPASNASGPTSPASTTRFGSRKPVDEDRDESTAASFSVDPTGREASEDVDADTSASMEEASSEEASLEEDASASLNAESATYGGTVTTYGDGTYADGTYGSYDETMEETIDETLGTATLTTACPPGTLTASKKYFHKDVVLNSLEDGANALVIRAMYFIPKPKAVDHVVVKIEASTISARDCLKCKGHGLTQAQLPFVPGFEFVGTIQTLGDKAKSDGQLREGDRVAGVSNFGGGNSRFISIPANRLTKISNDVKSTQAVCMIHDYMAALKALRLAKKTGSPFTGMNILITDGFSPVGQAVITLANMEGANIYCCADESKHSYLASLGAKCFVKNPDTWLPTATGTFDVVIDNSCVDSYNASWFALNQKGTLVCLAPVYNIGNDELPPSACGLDILELQQKWAGIKAKYMMTQTSFLNTATCYDDDTKQYRQDLRYLMFLLERGDVRPKIAERVSLDDVPDAQRLMQSGRANGTVVCVPWIEE